MAYRLRLTRLADQDFEQILDYTWVTWGATQYGKYRDLMLEAFAAITDDPRCSRSRARDDLLDGIRIYPAGRHYLIYRISRNDVTVVRILHQQMDLPQHLKAFN